LVTRRISQFFRVRGSWLRRHGAVAVASAAAAAGTCAAHGEVSGHDLDALAAGLGRSAGGMIVSPADIRWEPSRGWVVDLLLGRRALFLARIAGEDAHDVYTARVRVGPNGFAIDIAGARNLTNTPLGDDHALVVRGRWAAFATRAYGQEQSLTVLDLNGEGAENKTSGLLDRSMAAITNWQRTGATAGVGRVDVTFDLPGRAVALRLGETALEITLIGGDVRRAPIPSVARVDLLSGELTSGEGMHVEPVMHLPKRFSHWTVDTLRAVSWIGPAPIAWIEDQALWLRDGYRRLTFSSNGAVTDVIAREEPPPPVLDTSQASIEEAHWPPAPIRTIWESPEKGEGEWTVPEPSWLRRVPGVSADAPSAFYQTFVRPDVERPYARVLLVAMDMRQLDLDMEAGVEDPEPLTGPPGAGRIPKDPAVYRRVAAAFNGAFKTEHGHYGMMVHKRVLLPPVPGAASVVVLDDGRAGFGSWGAERKVGGIVGVADEDIASFRQNLDPLVDHGQVNPTGRNLWGFTLPGKGVQTERTALCVTTSGHLVYAWGDDLSATTLAKAMSMAGCDYAMHLDMNPYHTGFLFAAIDDLGAKKYKSTVLTNAMSIPNDRYIQYAPKDFFYVLTHDPEPPPLEGAAAWAPDGGDQPPPRWLPGLWATRMIGAQGAVDILDVEAGRATWRIRAGAKDAVLASPLREISGVEANHVLLSLGIGVAPERRPLGLATGGRLAVAIVDGPEWGLLIVDESGGLVIERADRAPELGAHDDLAELPIALWDGKRATDSMGAVVARAAIGITPSGRVVVARGTFASSAPLADALAAAGCTRALSLDRGQRFTARLDRAGTIDPPRARYDESVLYAVSMPLRPRAFRFDSATAVAQATPSPRATP
jgi:hypothetical protein